MFPSLTTPIERGASRYSSANNSPSPSPSPSPLPPRAISRDGRDNPIPTRDGTQSLTGPSISRRPSLNKLTSTPSPLRPYRSQDSSSPVPSTYTPLPLSSQVTSMAHNLLAPRRHQRVASGDAVNSDLAAGVARVSIRETSTYGTPPRVAGGVDRYAQSAPLPSSSSSGNVYNISPPNSTIMNGSGNGAGTARGIGLRSVMDPIGSRGSSPQPMPQSHLLATPPSAKRPVAPRSAPAHRRRDTDTSLVGNGVAMIVTPADDMPLPSASSIPLSSSSSSNTTLSTPQQPARRHSVGGPDNGNVSSSSTPSVANGASGGVARRYGSGRPPAVAPNAGLIPTVAETHVPHGTIYSNSMNNTGLAAPTASSRVRSRSPGVRAPVSPGHDGGPNATSVMGDRRVPSRGSMNDGGVAPSFVRDRSDNDDARTPTKRDDYDRERTPRDDDIDEQMEREKRDMERERQRQRMMAATEDDRRRSSLAAVIATRAPPQLGFASHIVSNSSNDGDDVEVTTDIPLRSASRGVLSLAGMNNNTSPSTASGSSSSGGGQHSSRRAGSRADDLRRGVLDSSSMSPARVYVDRSRSPTPTRVIPAKLRSGSSNGSESPELSSRALPQSARSASPLQLRGSARSESPQHIRGHGGASTGSAGASARAPPLIQSRDGPTSPHDRERRTVAAANAASIANNNSVVAAAPVTAVIAPRPSLRSGEAGPTSPRIMGRPSAAPSVSPIIAPQSSSSVSSPSVVGMPPPHQGKRRPTPMDDHNGKGMAAIPSAVTLEATGSSDSVDDFFTRRPTRGDDHSPVRPGTTGHTGNYSSVAPVPRVAGGGVARRVFAESPQSGRALSDTDSPQRSMPPSNIPSPSPTAALPVSAFSNDSGSHTSGEPMFRQSHVDYGRSPSNTNPRAPSVFGGMRSSSAQHTPFSPTAAHGPVGADEEATELNRPLTAALGRTVTLFPHDPTPVIPAPQPSLLPSMVPPMGERHPAYADDFTLSESDDLSASFDDPRMLKDRGQEVRTEPIVRSESPRNSRMFGGFGAARFADVNASGVAMTTAASYAAPAAAAAAVATGIAGFVATGDNDDLGASYDGRLAVDRGQEVRTEAVQRSESPRSSIQGGFGGRFRNLAAANDDDNDDGGQADMRTSGSFNFNVHHRGTAPRGGLQLNMDTMAPGGPLPSESPRHMMLGGTAGKLDLALSASADNLSRQSFDVSGGVFRTANGLVIGHDRIRATGGPSDANTARNGGGNAANDARLSASYGRGGLGGTLGGTQGGGGVALLHKPLELTRHNPLGATGGVNIANSREFKAATHVTAATGTTPSGGGGGHHGHHLGMDLGIGRRARGGAGESMAALGTAVDEGDVVKLGALGSGQTGTVYRGIYVTHKPDHDDSLLKNFGLLALKSVNVHDKAQRHQMEKELEAFAKTNCANILGFRGAWFNGTSITMALEYMDQGSLDIAVKRVPPLSEDVIRYITRELLKGLDHMHSRHQLHRDIKPANMLIDSEGHVKISDFGLVKQLDSSQEFSKTFVGTLVFLSPERIAGKPFSYTSDIWSIGISLIFLATGAIPLPNEYWGIMDSLKKSGPSLSRDRFSSLFCDFVDQCLVMDAAERGTCRSLLAHPFLAVSTVMPEWPFKRQKEASETDIESVCNAVVARIYPHATRFGSMADRARMATLATRLCCSVDTLVTKITSKISERMAAQQASAAAAAAAATGVTVTTPSSSAHGGGSQAPPTPAMGNGGTGGFEVHSSLPRSRGDSR